MILMSGDVSSKEEKYRILSFAKLEPIVVFGGKEFARMGGLLVGTGGVKACTVRFQPPVTISDDELDGALEMFENSPAKAEGVSA
jgi:acetylornithine/succinyldiaminopimelate/putrescine aminotransferase